MWPRISNNQKKDGKGQAGALGMVCVRCSCHGCVVATAATQVEHRIVCAGVEAERQPRVQGLNGKHGWSQEAARDDG